MIYSYEWDVDWFYTESMPLIWPKDGPGSVGRIIILNSQLAFAISTRGAIGHVLGWKGRYWEALSNGLPIELFYGLESDWTVRPRAIYAATDSRVYVSTDDGDTWQNVSDGLPFRSHMTGLGFLVEPDGTRHLYAILGGALFLVHVSEETRLECPIYITVHRFSRNIPKTVIYIARKVPNNRWR